MEFHTYRTIRDLAKHAVPKYVRKQNPRWLYEQLTAESHPINDELLVQAMGELKWEGLKRPYYNLYPSIIPMLTRLNLAVDSGLIRLPMTSLCVRLPKDPGKNPLKFDWKGRQVQVCCILATDMDETEGFFVRMDIGECRPGRMTLHPFVTLLRKPGMTVEQLVTGAEVLPVVENQGIVVPDAVIIDCIRLCCTLCLLDEDPEVISPDVFADDRNKFEATGDQEFVKKAHRKGKVGWVVGRNIEMIPHIRRPHMALVWTGERRKIPKIVPRKGSVVHREMVEKIPTGFQEPGGNVQPPDIPEDENGVVPPEQPNGEGLDK